RVFWGTRSVEAPSNLGFVWKMNGAHLNAIVTCDEPSACTSRIRILNLDRFQRRVYITALRPLQSHTHPELMFLSLLVEFSMKASRILVVLPITFALLFQAASARAQSISNFVKDFLERYHPPKVPSSNQQPVATPQELADLVRGGQLSLTMSDL